MTVEEVRRHIERITPVDAREATSIELILDRLTWPGSAYDEGASDHHVTASAFVVSERGVVLHRHRRLGIWVQPGGHVEPGESPEAACLRETLEETGLVARHCQPVELFHVDVHPGPRGHTHYDLRYLVVAPPSDPVPAPGESPDIAWVDLAVAPQRAVADLGAALRKLAASLDSRGVPD